MKNASMIRLGLLACTIFASASAMAADTTAPATRASMRSINASTTSRPIPTKALPTAPSPAGRRPTTNIAQRESADEAKHNGHLTKAENRRLNRAENRNSRAIHRQRH